MVGLRDDQRGFAGMNDGLNKKWPEGIREPIHDRISRNVSLALASLQ
uniref:Uncharacterized protein n=1 Tax=Vitis vinifera TaxID=29760 RepID=F6H100_VITVI